MARSKGLKHYMSIRSGIATKKLVRSECDSVIEKLKVGHAAELALALRNRVQATASYEAQIMDLTDTCGRLRDLVVRYDDLSFALARNKMDQPTNRCLETLRASLFEAAAGLGVKRV